MMLEGNRLIRYCMAKTGWSFSFDKLFVPENEWERWIKIKFVNLCKIVPIISDKREKMKYLNILNLNSKLFLVDMVKFKKKRRLRLSFNNVKQVLTSFEIPSIFYTFPSVQYWQSISPAFYEQLFAYFLWPNRIQTQIVSAESFTQKSF